jgi:hypothetical protein
MSCQPTELTDKQSKIVPLVSKREPLTNGGCYFAEDRWCFGSRLRNLQRRSLKKHNSQNAACLRDPRGPVFWASR